ncbi:MAG: MazG nucleotide pyrophosphohydrolase domain-containing protein [Candidatus Nanoarchaeia archaeon]
MDIKDLTEFSRKEHARLIDHYNLREDSKLKYTLFAKLIEEIGELSEAILMSDSLQRGEKLRKDNHDELAYELADVLLCTSILAQELNIDIEKALNEKIEKIKKRNYA